MVDVSSSRNRSRASLSYGEFAARFPHALQELISALVVF